MTLDIRGSIKNTKLSTNPYVVFEELISNAIDSYLIRKDAEPSAPALDVRVDVVFRTSDLFGELEVMSVRCRDKGSVPDFTMAAVMESWVRRWEAIGAGV